MAPWPPPPQTTDVKVNQVTSQLFKAYPDAQTMATAEVSDVLVGAPGLLPGLPCWPLSMQCCPGRR